MCRKHSADLEREVLAIGAGGGSGFWTRGDNHDHPPFGWWVAAA
jgi:hypothetical protein